MAKKRNIVQYRERLDKTLASPDLTNDHILKTLVKSQVMRSSKLEIEEYKEKLLETKTAEVSNFLDMLRSASVDDSGGSSKSHSDWKLKQDNEEFRVMYREGPEGTPFHTLLVEGYVDGPIDVCLCLSWETSLYKKWWPQTTIPTFKIMASECLQKVQIGEQISLVRMKISWPLSTREAIVHYYVFEYFQDDLLVVLLNSVPESKSINDTINGFNRDAIPEAKDVVRIDLVGGFVMQKVTMERSYFRTIANMDIKLDFVPPSLINFISRQLIGNGFRLYQKAVASKMNHDQEFIKALGDSFYVRIREALYNVSGSKAMDGEELEQILPAEELTQSEQDGRKDISWEDRSNQYANNFNGEILDADSEEIVEVHREESAQIEGDFKKVRDIPFEEVYTSSVLKDKRNGEIVDADDEEIVAPDSEEIVHIMDDAKKVHDIQIEEDDTRSVLKGKSNVYISSEVKQALDTLERAISRLREKGGTVDSYSAKLNQLCSKNEVSVEVSSSNVLEKISEEEPQTNSEIQNFRHTGTNPNLKEVNHNKVVPASPEQHLSRPIETSLVDSYSLENGTTLDQTICDNKKLKSDAVQDMSSEDPKKSSRQKKLNNSSDVPKQSTRQKKHRYCCFLH
ncbi:uncharacterized protein LOC133306211 [Gastrolobium bilobum]|uniref:uncharacterized protein LOC133306211 n=1 Tax=Gastrolobium bilobum TaxID=150636 RepID=UPI002AB2F930|nr:uncharacterized protein LOC133306211 [Gastrolobium bilobum]XP_061362487.1 uncharacterized protein LOC133306211 [Gastrolobium bilobum]XP_061362488.1 uncharacterized protein LOC133306211 [Gastrolobium bilobum]XP_061362489.1 uncharacterized protein LOC133306211 [Gastrolobium bilobum]XP_061362490.1 uncharacterized protein LOC133306211 [Gastrolobium bilobum]XP_061362491.1 uncharacterized protein LOC133306211 [Gastrolobium bilobum]XP_061362492.1 uncharacterized protein LOC133306211 [Gastrolobium